VIVGRAHEVLGNMADGSYDLVFLDTDPIELQTLLPTAISLLRPGGVIAIPHALWNDRVPNPVLRDDETVAMRATNKLLLENQDFLGTMSLVGDGLLLASKRISATS
jgi:predicted O-methyltransferase YrrM